jgi:hypothetical protein
MHVGETASVTVRFVARTGISRLEINVYDPGNSGVVLVSAPVKRVFSNVAAGTVKEVSVRVRLLAPSGSLAMGYSTGEDDEGGCSEVASFDLAPSAVTKLQPGAVDASRETPERPHVPTVPTTQPSTALPAVTVPRTPDAVDASSTAAADPPQPRRSGCGCALVGLRQ